jgi:hypothetical protein
MKMKKKEAGDALVGDNVTFISNTYNNNNNYNNNNYYYYYYYNNNNNNKREDFKD